MKFLIADDDRVSRELLMNLLNKYGECDLTVNGIEAIEAFLMALDDEKPYDVILLDLMMPLFDGEKVLKTIRNIEKKVVNKSSNKVKVIITSALNDGNLKAKLSEYGFDEYLTKPIDTSKLLEIIKSYKTL